jgi:transcriptional regulator
MLRGATGFEIAIKKIEAALKLSQNRNQKDYQNIVHELAELNTPQAYLFSWTLTKNKYEIQFYYFWNQAK